LLDSLLQEVMSSSFLVILSAVKVISDLVTNRMILPLT